MKTSIRFLGAFIFCMLCLVKANAQGLSLSFNLKETDTLANMIADSKKYDIASLTLAGHINDVNTKYIQDLNLNGKLSNLDLSNVISISPSTQNREIVIKGYNKYNINSISTILQYYGCPKGSADSLAQKYPGHSAYGPVKISIRDQIHQKQTVRSYLLIYEPDAYFWGTHTSSKTCVFPMSVLFPLRIFDINSFKKFILPSNLICVGGYDCSYRVKSCEEYVLGNKIHVIGENAFKDSHIGTITFNSTISEIKANAFENATGNCLANSQFVESVESIGDNAFKNSSLLEDTNRSVTLQAKKIGNNAFSHAVIPKYLSLPNIHELGDSAFMATNIESVDIGNIIKVIRNSIFENCTALQIINGGANINYIGKRAFYKCNQLNAFTPSNNLGTIEQEAFADNTALVSFSIPNNATSIGYNAFARSGLKELDLGLFGDYRRDIVSGCDSLEIIAVSSDNTKLKSANGVLLSKDGTKIISYPCAKEDAMYEISNQVTEVADSAFYSVNKLRSLTISETVTQIGKSPFTNSSILEITALPASLPNVTDNETGLDQSKVRLYVHEKDYSTYYIGKYWGDFKKIFILEKATSPDNLINVEVAGTLPEYIGYGNQNKYNTLRLSGYLDSDDIRYLREMAGRDVRGNKTSVVLTDLDFSQASIVKGGSSYYIKNENSSGRLSTSNNIVGESMFEGCNFTNLAISDSTTKIGDKALSDCQLESFKLPAATKELNLNSFFGMATLKEFIVDSDNPNFESLNGVLFSKDIKSLLLYPYAKQGEQYSTPETTTSIGEQAFGGSLLKTVTINEGLKEIGAMAFNNLGSLEGICLPSTLETIGHRAFWGCNNLLDITCKAYYPPTLKYYGLSYYDNFSNKTYENAVLLVPKKDGGYLRYKRMGGWKLFNHVVESDDWMSGIQTIVNIDNDEIVKCYDLNGRVVKNSYHGVNILKMSNGTTKKVFVK